MGESCLDGFGGDHIKTEVIFGRTLPHIVLIQIGLVPDLPMPDVPMKAVCPAFVVVADDLDADARPLIHVRRHIGVQLAHRVLNGGPQTVDDLCAAVHNGLERRIGVLKDIIGRVGLICGKIRENLRNVHSRGMRILRVVHACIRETGGLVGTAQVGQTAKGRGAVVHAVNRLDGADFAGSVDRDHLNPLCAACAGLYVM